MTQGRRRLWIGLAVVMAVGSLVRIVPVVNSGFPLNDGALFLTFIEAIRDAGYALPEFVAFNGTELPFAYPPGGLYLSAAVIDATGLAPIDVLRVLPLVFSLAAIPVAFLVYRQVLGADALALVATAAFALMARSYNWSIAGGGVTRAPGFFLALVSIAAAIRMVRSPDRRWAIAGGATAGLAILTHPEAGLFAALSLPVVAFLESQPWRARLMSLALAAVVAAVVAGPWALLTLGRHGIEPIVGASQTGGAVLEGAFRLLTFRFSDGYLELLGVLGAIGLGVCLLKRRWILPAWTALVFLVGSRASLTYGTVPIAAAAAVAVGAFFRVARLEAPERVETLTSTWKAAAIIGVLLVAGTGDSLASAMRSDSPLRALTPDDRDALSWAERNTQPSATFLVISGEPWPWDSAGEWFPVLAGRESAATVQGSEWMGPGAYAERRDRHAWLLACVARQDDACVGEWRQAVGPVDYLLVSDGRVAYADGSPCCRSYADLAAAVTGGRVVYENADVAIAEIGPR